MSGAVATAALALTLQSWVGANVPPDEKVLCQRAAKGEYFFVARAPGDDKLRLGSRVNVSGYAPESFSISVRWRLRDENERAIARSAAPLRVRDELLQGDGKAFAESVQIQTLNLGAAKRLLAHIVITKCPVHPCAEGSGHKARRYAVPLCEKAL